MYNSSQSGDSIRCFPLIFYSDGCFPLILTAALCISSQIKSPTGEAEFSKTDAVEGKFAFNANIAGAHSICVDNGGAAMRRISVSREAAATLLQW